MMMMMIFLFLLATRIAHDKRCYKTKTQYFTCSPCKLEAMIPIRKVPNKSPQKGQLILDISNIKGTSGQRRYLCHFLRPIRYIVRAGHLVDRLCHVHLPSKKILRWLVQLFLCYFPPQVQLERVDESLVKEERVCSLDFTSSITLSLLT